MHTLLPFDDFKVTALCLTDKLLRQQMADCVQILNIIHEVDTPPNYTEPTVQAWRGSELQLCEFGLTCYETFIKRSKWPVTDEVATAYISLERHLDLAGDGDLTLPSWYGQDWVHLEYRGLLRWIDPETYKPIFPDVHTCPPERFRYPKIA